MAWHTRILEDDAVKTEYYHFDYATERVVLETKWKGLGRIAEECKGKYNLVDENARWGDWAHVASIPLCVIEEEHRKTGKNALQDKGFLRHLCNRPDLQAFRTRPGKL